MKLLSVFSILIIILCVIVAGKKNCAKECEREEPVFARDDSGTFGNNFKWSYNSSTYTLTIEGEGDMIDWGSIAGTPWYNYSSSVAVIEFKAFCNQIYFAAFVFLPFLMLFINVFAFLSQFFTSLLTPFFFC